MASLYSTCFYETASAPTTPTVIGYPPTGFIWVIRDISVKSPGQYYEGNFSLEIHTSSGGPIWFVGIPFVSGSRYFQWQGREVIPTNVEVIIQGDRVGWGVRINGYLLSTP